MTGTSPSPAGVAHERFSKLLLLATCGVRNTALETRLCIATRTTTPTPTLKGGERRTYPIGTAQVASRELGGVDRTGGTVCGVSNSGPSVVDASAIPFLLPSRLSATVYATAERFTYRITGRSPL